MGIKAHGRILFWEGACMWILSAPPGVRYPKTAVHAHHAIQVTLALTGRIDFDGADGETTGGVAVAIAPDAHHAFEGTGLVAHLFIAPEGQLGRAIASALFGAGPIAAIPSGPLGELPARLLATFEDRRCTDERLTTLGRAVVGALAGGEAQESAPDPRVAKLIAWTTARLDEPISLGDVAGVVGLSPSRTRHLFVEQTGLPFRTYLLWLRLVRALEAFAAGESLTEAAHAAGFADSAHLSRTFRRNFGIAAATLEVTPPRPTARP